MDYVYIQEIDDKVTACYTVNREAQMLVGINFLYNKKDIKYCSTNRDDIPKELIFEEFIIPDSFFEPRIDNAPIKITKIETYVLSSVNNIIIKKLVIPEGVQTLHKKAFAEISFKIEEIVIPSSVKKIPSQCFQNCENLNKVTMPKTITSIEPYAFSYTYGLKSVEIPENCRTIKDNAFRNSDIEEVTFSDKGKLNNLGESVFAYCRKLKRITWPAKVDVIPMYTFYNCVNLEEVEINNSITNIGHLAFFATSVKTLDLSKGLSPLGPSEISHQAVPEGVKIIFPYFINDPST